MSVLAVLHAVCSGCGFGFRVSGFGFRVSGFARLGTRLEAAVWCETATLGLRVSEVVFCWKGAGVCGFVVCQDQPRLVEWLGRAGRGAIVGRMRRSVMRHGRGSVIAPKSQCTGAEVRVSVCQPKCQRKCKCIAQAVSAYLRSGVRVSQRKSSPRADAKTATDPTMHSIEQEHLQRTQPTNTAFQLTRPRSAGSLWR